MAAVVQVAVTGEAVEHEIDAVRDTLNGIMDSLSATAWKDPHWARVAGAIDTACGALVTAASIASAFPDKPAEYGLEVG